MAPLLQYWSFRNLLLLLLSFFLLSPLFASSFFSFVSSQPQIHQIHTTHFLSGRRFLLVDQDDDDDEPILSTNKRRHKLVSDEEDEQQLLSLKKKKKKPQQDDEEVLSKKKKKKSNEEDDDVLLPKKKKTTPSDDDEQAQQSKKLKMKSSSSNETKKEDDLPKKKKNEEADDVAQQPKKKKSSSTSEIEAITSSNNKNQTKPHKPKTNSTPPTTKDQSKLTTTKSKETKNKLNTTSNNSSTKSTTTKKSPESSKSITTKKSLESSKSTTTKKMKPPQSPPNWLYRHDDDEDEDWDLVSEFREMPTKFQKTFIPDLRRISTTSRIYLNKASKDMSKGFKPYVGNKYASSLATVFSLAFIIIPFLLASLLFSRIKAYFSLQRLLIFIQIYLSIYFSILFFSSLVTGLEPLRFFYATSQSTYVCLQLMQTLGYALYLLLLIMYLVLVFSTDSGLAQKLLSLAQTIVGLAVGLHFYMTVFHRVVLHQPPKTNWKVHGIYATCFLLICLFARAERRKMERKNS